MKNIIIMLLIALAFNACNTSSLSLSETGDVKLHYNDETRIIAHDVTKENILSFSDLYIHQYKLIGKDGNVLFGEYAETDLMFQFSKSELDTLMYIFDDSSAYEMVYKVNNLQFVQIQLKDKTYVNVLIQANNPQDYYSVYGFSNESFMEIAMHVRVKDTKVVAPKFKAIIFNQDSRPQTNWNDKLVYFTPLIEPVRGMRVR
ncbi:MAG: hypothetical protein Q9M32_01440 [Sulfurimonas sp.]|nr:hypothetical protein [Sulfurimonas sp.]MDQ7061721.1 hypothetical protein [Sulfurimonas sp.]